MAPATCIRSAPILQVRDVIRSRNFYTDKIGFSSHGVWGDPPCFCIVGRGTITIMLDAAQDPGPLPVNQYWAAYVYVDDVEALHREYKAAGVQITRGPEDMPYGCREFDVRDPDGHLIAFGQDLQPSAEGPGL